MAKNNKTVKVNIYRRMRGIFCFFMACMFLLLCRTAFLQTIEAPKLREMGESRRTRDNMITPRRGIIYDRNKKILAQSASTEKVFVNPGEISEKNNEEIAKFLADVLEMEYDEVYNKVKGEGYNVLVAKQVEKNKANTIREKGYAGIVLDEDAKRYYPGGNFAAHVIGFTGDDNQGLEGLEYIYDKELKGIKGRVKKAINADGRDMPVGEETYFDAVEGNNLVLTVDEVIQHFAEKHLETAWIDNNVCDGAACIVMDPKTGGILAMVTKPDYDLNQPMKILDEGILAGLEEFKEDEKKYEEEYALQRQKLWRNKATNDTYEPGSTFKALTAAAALEEQTSSLSDSFFCDGIIHVSDWDIKCHKTSGHGGETFSQAVYNSCNPAFIEIGLKLGVENFTKYFKAFGLTEKTGFDLPESVGSYYTAENMKTIDLATNSFGQSFTISPIQLITAFSAVANGGHLMQPYIVKQICDEEGNIIKNTEPREIRQVISEQTSKTMREILEGVVSYGGGQNAYVPGYRIAGKTGTSEKVPRGSGEYIASFMGFAPADNPQIACLVLLDNPQGEEYYGGMIAAPVVGNIINDTLRYLGVQPQYTQEEMANSEIVTPSLMGMSVSDATKKISESGLKYQVMGDGDTIIDQTPKAGVGVRGGAVVVLYTREGELSRVIVPDLTGLNGVDCNIALANCGLNFKVSGPGKTDTAGVAMAVSQSPAPGEEVDAGTIVSVQFRYASAE